MQRMSRPQFTCRAVPTYLEEQSEPSRAVFAWSYTVTIENTGDVAAQLIGRQWLVSNAHGKTDEVRGLAVVGHQPLLQPGEKFEYSSWTHLDTPHGTMEGTFFCMTSEARPFEAEVPMFVLSRPHALH